MAALGTRAQFELASELTVSRGPVCEASARWIHDHMADSAITLTTEQKGDE
jgi:hypothetical protein